MLTRILLITLCLASVLGCKKEFMPEPVGETIRSPDYPSLEEALGAGSYTLFKAAWDRSKMGSFIAANFPQTKLTVLAPNDKAMRETGYTAEKIASTAVADLDTLLRYHILIGQVDRVLLETSLSDQFFNSLLNHPTMQEGIKQGTTRLSTIAYRYQHALQLAADALLDNGQQLVTDNWTPVVEGMVIGIDRVVQRPTKQMIDVLREDGRFSLFLKAVGLTVAAYDNYLQTSWSAAGTYIGYPYFLDEGYFPVNTFRSTDYAPHVIRFTLFAPTDEAFNRIGIYNEADLEALNQRSEVQFGGWGSGDVMMPVDSLLRMHRIAVAAPQVSYDYDYATSSYQVTMCLQRHSQAANLVFYNHSLTNTLMRNYVTLIQTASGESDGFVYLEHDFGLDNMGRVSVRHLGSVGESASIIDPNINTLQGPIHAVDRLIVPQDFSMWHLAK